jgi:probable addiction module antidote protein
VTHKTQRPKKNGFGGLNVGHEMFDPKRLRANPTAIAEYLTEAFERSDLPGILNAIKSVMLAQNVKELAELTGMRRDGLYRSFASGKTDPHLSRVLSLFEGLDVQIVVKPLPPRKKPPRPKLGRPRSSSKNRRRI